MEGLKSLLRIQDANIHTNIMSAELAYPRVDRIQQSVGTAKQKHRFFGIKAVGGKQPNGRSEFCFFQRSRKLHANTFCLWEGAFSPPQLSSFGLFRRWHR